MPSPPLPPSHKGIVGLFTLCSIMKVRAVGNRLSFPICTSTQRKSKCISEMVSVCLKLDNKWTHLHACGRKRTPQHVQKKHNNYTPDTHCQASLFAAHRKGRCLTVQSQNGINGGKKEKKPATKQNFHMATAKRWLYSCFSYPSMSKGEVWSISTGLGCRGKMIAFPYT